MGINFRRLGLSTSGAALAKHSCEEKKRRFLSFFGQNSEERQKVRNCCWKKTNERQQMPKNANQNTQKREKKVRKT